MRSDQVILELSCKPGSMAKPWCLLWAFSRSSRLKAVATAQSDSHGITEMNGIAPAKLHPLKLHWVGALLNKTLKHMLKFKHMSKQFQGTYLYA